MHVYPETLHESHKSIFLETFILFCIVTTLIFIHSILSKSSLLSISLLVIILVPGSISSSYPRFSVLRCNNQYPRFTVFRCNNQYLFYPSPCFTSGNVVQLEVYIVDRKSIIDISPWDSPPLLCSIIRLDLYFYLAWTYKPLRMFR